jgi:hypothetical protein
MFSLVITVIELIIPFQFNTKISNETRPCVTDD